jgi:hypothetical protein
MAAPKDGIAAPGSVRAAPKDGIAAPKRLGNVLNPQYNFCKDLKRLKKTPKDRHLCIKLWLLSDVRCVGQSVTR